MIFPQNFEEKIGFDKIRNHLKNNCLSTLGKDKVDSMKFMVSFNEVKTSLSLADEFKSIINSDENFPIQYFFDVREVLNRIKIEGAFIETENIFDLKRSLEEINAILKFLNKSEEEKFPYLKQLAAEVPFFPFVVTRIDRILNKEGHIRDDASPEIARLRKEMKAKMSGASKIIHNLLQKAKNDNVIEADVQLTIRDGKMLIPVPASAKRKIKGYVADESATGKTSFIEPLEMIELNNEIRELEFAERREIIKILVDFSNDIRPYIDDLLLSYDFLAEIDFIRAKALFSNKIDALKPNISNKSGFDIRLARHPLLYISFMKEKRKVVPLDISLNHGHRIILISGPNAGGKSVCLKTVGILQYMFQCGMLIPLAESSTMGIFKSIFIDIGDEQSIEDDLSTYSSHLKNMKKFIENADENSLILIDEFGAGTEPALGGAIAEALLEKFSKLQTFGVITTHYGNLKHFASADQNMVNGAMLFDNLNMRALYELEIGRPGSSFAFEIAKSIGLPSEVLQIAEDKIGKQHIDFDKHLQEIDRERKRLSNLNKSLNQKELHLETVIQKYEDETKLTAQKRKDIITEAKQAADNILSGLNKTIEKSISEIRKTNAEKEKTKEIRKNLDDLKQDTEKRFEHESKFLSKKIEDIQKKKKTEKKADNTEKEEKPSDLKIGDKISLNKGQGIGEVLEIKDNKVLISLGNMHMFVDEKQLTKISGNQAKKQLSETTHTVKKTGLDLGQVKSKFSYGIDVRGKRADEALQLVTTYIDECIMVEASEVRILHGKGNGILRQLIRDYLKTFKIIKSVKDEKVEFGGAGITVVVFDF
jgi:DNA mismatch repair protein MutS2